MRVGTRLFLALCAAAMASAMPVRAQTGPVIVIPGKPGVPVIINGVIADGAVVYGDWGLARPNNSGLVIEGLVAYAEPWDSRSYYPATGRMPRLGRQEVEPPKRQRPRSASFHRGWSIESNFKQPVTEYPPFNPPPVIMAPRERRR
jgi:hypothetical protein